MRAAALLAGLALLVAGCSDGKGGGDGPADAGAPGSVPMLHGFVFDPALRPVEGATVKVLDTNASVVTDDEGFFGFDGLPVEQFLVLVATKPGYVPSSKQITLVPDTPVRLNFSIEQEPVKVAYRDVLPFEGLLACEVATAVSAQNNTMGCNPGGLENRNRWDFSVNEDLAGAVVELFWDPNTAAAGSLGMRLETLELGQLNVVLGEVVGPSPLRITVPQSTAERYYTGGGLMRLTVFAASDAHQNEAGIGYSAAVQQSFEAFSSLFYVQPPDPSYSLANG